MSAYDEFKGKVRLVLDGGKRVQISRSHSIAEIDNGIKGLKIGDIVLKPGDTLLLETHPEFFDQHRYSRDFYLVSRVEGYTPPRHERAWIAGAIFLCMVIAAGTGALDMIHAAMLAEFMMWTPSRRPSGYTVGHHHARAGASIGCSRPVLSTQTSVLCS